MEKVFEINNLHCAHCGAKIEEALNKLEARRTLVGQYDKTWLALFSKKPASDETRRLHAGDDILFVDAEQLYLDR